jgi:cytoskeletal protein CcmA (bactofilin family)
MRLVALALLTALLTLWPGAAAAQSGPLVVAADAVFRGDLATVDRAILVQGVVEGDVTSWSGAITVEGTVEGDVVSYAGPVTLGPDARVSGSVLSMAGGVSGAGPAVAGQVLGERPVAGGRVVASVATIFGRQPETIDATIPRPLVSGALALLAGAVIALLAAIWPARTAGVALGLRRAPLRAAILGLLTTLLAAVLLPPLAGLLALTLVGLPLVMPLLMVLQLPYLFGAAAVARLIGDALGAQSGRPAVSAALGAAALMLPLAAVGAAAPVVSAAIFYLVAGVGLGAAILTRAGAYALAARGPAH